MASLLEQIITVIVGTVTGATRAVRDGRSAIEDFFYVRIRGLPFIVLGSRQVGKSTLIEWLKHNMNLLEDFAPEPTAAGGETLPDFTAKIGDTHMKLKPNRDVGGEYAMWETDWLELFREAQPRGVIFILDHTDVHLQKDALNFVMQMVEDEPAAARNLKAFFILVNKSDIWSDQTNLDDIMSNYRNEQKRLISLADRADFKYAITYGSLMTGYGVKALMREFFNVIRPKSRDRKEIA
jgi:hypothetical protein